MTPPPTLHASCVARHGEGVLLLGGSGAGKSDLALRLLSRGFRLVADDRVIVQDGIASAPPALAGLLEVRGLGVFRLGHEASARLRLAVMLDAPGERLPLPASHAQLGVPQISIEGRMASAPDRIMLALDAVCGRATQLAGAFA